MNCINEGLIQKYIDGETTSSERTAIEEHLLNCEICSNKIETQSALASHIKKAIHLLDKPAITIPEFTPAPPQKIFNKHKIKRILYYVSAACVLVLVFFMFQTQEQSSESNTIFLYNFDGEYDANRTISQQELILNVIDAQGKVTEYQFE